VILLCYLSFRCWLLTQLFVTYPVVYRIFTAIFIFLCNNVIFFRKFEANNRGFSNFEELVEAVLAIPENFETVAPGDEENGVELQAATFPQEQVLTPLEEIRQLEESRRCKRCHREDACVVFMPCGHLVCCVSCADEVEQCPVCKEFIQERVRSFIS